MHADAAISFVGGTADPADLTLVETTERGPAAGIAQAKPGNRRGDETDFPVVMRMLESSNCVCDNAW